MSENISLVKKTQNTFSHKISKLKKDLKAKDIKITKLSKKSKSNGKGIVLLKNIPPGFEQMEMQQYFKQFGKVLNVLLVRSIKTGKSKGHAYILFEHDVVAEVVAETMNNYLMYNHLVKAIYIPSNFKLEQKFRRPEITRNNCLLNKNIEKIKLIKNSNISNEIVDKRIKRRKSLLKKSLMNLKKAGINYNFEIPEIKSNAENIVEKKEELPVLLINQDDKEIIFKTPPNVIKKLVKFGKTNSKNSKSLINKFIKEDNNKTIDENNSVKTSIKKRNKRLAK